MQNSCRKILFRALERRKDSASTLLKCVRSINSTKFPQEGFGEASHTSSSEPWFYDTAYKLVKHQGAIPVDDVRGVCFVAQPVKEEEQSSTEQDCKREDGDRCKLCGANVKCRRKCVKCGANLHCKWQCGAKIERKCQCGAKVPC